MKDGIFLSESLIEGAAQRMLTWPELGPSCGLGSGFGFRIGEGTEAHAGPEAPKL
jgi:hypothetical protein